jgi:predicted AlkP superfamily phosphohydrolase/phosphomutase
MQDVQFTLEWQERLLHEALSRGDWDCLMAVISVTDRVQHMTYQFHDVEHPLYDAAAADREFAFFDRTIRLRDAVPEIYRQMDRVLGEVMQRHLQPGDTLLVCSDHGFQSFRWQVHLNNWLHEQGYLALKPGVGKRDGQALAFVDWSKTKLYSLGMGFLYVNLAGREPGGIVQPAEVDALLAEVKHKLLASRDPRDGTPFCKDAYVTKEVHSGPYLSLEADMLVGFAPPYRVSWGMTLGGFHFTKNDVGIDVPGPVITANDSNWSGDHISMALPDVAGVFFSNRVLDSGGQDPRLLQIAPTALALLGVSVPPEMDLEPLRLR